MTLFIILAGAGLFLLVLIAALLVDIRGQLGKIESNISSLDFDWHKLNKEELARKSTYEYEQSRTKDF